MAELFLSAFLDVLFDRLASRDILGFLRQLLGGVDSDIMKWEKKFKMIQAVLTDAEEKQLTEKAVKQWLDDLQDLAYDAEDILDDFATQALEQKLMAHHNQGSSSQLVSFIPVSLNPSAIMSNFSMDSRIDDITRRLEELCQEKVELGLIPGGTSSTAAAPRRLPTSCLPTERTVFGRHQDKAKILDMVCTDTPSDHADIAVVPIVGMGGVGKTTLARQVYNDKAVEDSRFDVKTWVCVSDVFDVLRISKELLESITSASCAFSTLNEVQVRLRQAVDGKKILVVLDDVWNEDDYLWEVLKAPFLAAAPNSKIIVTTRHSEVALTMTSTQQYNLQCLSDEDCWSLFKMHASVSRDISAHRKKVVGKCGGLPLAAKTLGGLLRRKKHDEWDKILDSNILQLPQQQNGILPVLRLSYHYLPSHLKRCFAYCAIFPKDYEFERSELVLLWMAEGLIQQSGSKQPEEWGREYFEDLLSRLIFEKSKDDSSKFVMHDLVHDLAQFVAGETSLAQFVAGETNSKTNLKEANKSSRRFEMVRHLSYKRDALFDAENTFKDLCKFENLRTFLPESKYGLCITCKFLPLLLQKFKKLRVLSLKGYIITELPDSIGGLKLLRYLNLTSTDVISLPESTSSLLNLQILILRGCKNLLKLPSKMRKLINLRHLDIEGARLLKEMPLGMEELKNLWKLSNFIVGKGGTVSGLKDLKNLKFISGQICISGLENVENSNDARDAALRDKENLEAVSLKWVSQLHISHNEVEKQEDTLDMLRPHERIKVLSIEHYGGAKFPQWMRNPFSKMEDLTLKNCENCTSLPSLGLVGSLKRLIINGMKAIKSVGFEFYGKDCSKPFQSLETLCFEDLKEWECWDINGLVAGFSNLRELSIVKCPKLSGKLPEHLPCLEKLLVEKCSELIVSFSSYPILRKLEIDECKGVVCRTNPSFSKMEDLTLKNCENCTSLPSLGLMGSLKRLIIKGIKAIKSVGFEFYGKDCSKPFQSLETLCFEDLKEWECWYINGLVAGFSNLRELSIVKCPKLSGKLPEHLPCLEKLLVEKCSELIVSFSSYPILRKLEIDECKGLVCRTLIDSKLIDVMIISNSSLLVYGREGMMHDNCTAAESTSVTITNILELGKFLKQGFQEVETLRVVPRGYWQLELERGWLKSGIHVRTISDEVSFEEGGVTLVQFPKIKIFLKNLRFLRISQCSTLKSLPEEIIGSSSKLESLLISSCNSLTSIGRCNLPSSLQSLEIKSCKMLRHLVDGDEDAASSSSSSSSVMLRYLSIEFCSELTSLSLGTQSLEALVHLKISDCQKLESLPDGLHKLNCLEGIYITRCPSIVSFPESGLPNTMQGLGMMYCEKLEALPKDMHKLNSLECLIIIGCPRVVSFLEEGFPTNLTYLSIDNMKVNKALIEWGLHRFTSLTQLKIEGCDDAEMEMMLPASLTELELSSWSKLKCLSSTCFQSLTSLQCLIINDCPKLTSFPEEGLPSSLGELRMWRCPKLEEEYKRNKGKVWSTIALIPNVEIEGKSI